jgi:hypothetical protein
MSEGQIKKYQGTTGLAKGTYIRFCVSEAVVDRIIIYDIM